MRIPSALPALLVQLAATVAAGAGCTLSHDSCEGYDYKQQDITVTPAVACAIAAEGDYGKACNAACGPGYGVCSLPLDYVNAYNVASDAGPEAGADAGAAKVCPSESGDVKVHCSSFPCEGRRTAGIDEPMAVNDAGLGAHFAASSYLEAVSVHAFARLHLELASHGAPEDLLARVRRAESDEVRHTESTRALAIRFGSEPEAPVAIEWEPRSLFAVALENAVEGCVRETYGAAIACLRALRARDPSVRAVMETIARDECEHAELGFRIAAWAEPLLREDERAAIQTAMREAIGELRDRVDDRLDQAERAICGGPTPAERRELAERLDREVISLAA